MPLLKYLKAPVSGSAAQYADTELRKIEAVTNGFFTSIQELLDMAAAVEQGSFIVTGTGFVTAPSATMYYARSGNIVVLFFSGLSGTSNATTFTITGLPAALRPSVDQGLQACVTIDNTSSVALGAVGVLASGVIDVRRALTGAGWTAANTKSLAQTNIVYLLN